MSLGLLADVSHLWYDKYSLQDAEQRYYNPSAACNGNASSGDCELRALVGMMQKRIEALEKRVAQLERGEKRTSERTSRTSKSEATCKSAPCAKKDTKAAAPKAAEKDDDDFELFDDEGEEEDEEKKKLYEERVKMYASKKAQKPALIAKSQVILNVKPWDDETDLKEMERRVRTITMDGLLWGVSKTIPVAFGIKMVQIVCVVEDDKVSTDELCEKITDDNEDLVQSVDIAAFQKI